MKTGGQLILLSVLAACAAVSQDFGDEAAPTAAVERPAIIAAADWGSEPDPIPDDRRHTPRLITVHHAGVLWNVGDDPYRKLTGLQSWGKRDKDWPDVPYHFLISPDGRIFEGRSLDFAGETNTEYDTAGHALVQIWGNFEEQRVSREQLVSAVHLTAWLCREHGISPETIAGHRDHSAQTSCPGADLHRYITGGQFRAWVEATLAGEEPGVELLPALPDGPTEFIPQD